MLPLRAHTATFPSIKLHTALPRRAARLAQATLADQQGRRPFSRADPGQSPTKLSSVNNFHSAGTSRAAQISEHFSTTAPTPQNQQSDNMTTTLPTRGGFEGKGPSVFTTRKIGAPHTLEHRIYIEKDGVPLSPFHDIPLYANEQQTVLNMVVEIPRWTNAKQEVRCVQSNASPTLPSSQPFAPHWCIR